MAEAGWDRTASVLAMLYNCHRDPKRTHEHKARDHNPFARPARPLKVGIGVLKDVFIDRKMPMEAQS